MSEYNEFSEEKKTLWKSYVLKLLLALYKIKSKELLWIIIQQIYEYTLYCIPRDKVRPLNVNDIKRFRADDVVWKEMCNALVLCRNIATHRGFETNKSDDLIYLLNECSSELRELIGMFFDDEAKYFDKLLDDYALYMN